VAQFWWLLLPFVAIACYVFVRVALRYSDLSLDSLPGFLRTDTAIVLHWLAVAVRQNRPIAEMTRFLAAYHPRRSMRLKLDRAAKRVEQGADWCDSLRQTGLIGRPEVAVFRSAERTGNLVWALEEMAAGSVRRTAYRLRALVTFLFPWAVLLVGGCVFTVVLGCFTPLLALIQKGG
jgi:type II secretory pathway component PulF